MMNQRIGVNEFMQLPLECYRVEQIRQIELAAQKNGISSDQMILRAAAAAFLHIEQVFPMVETVAIFCGSGHNGADGLVLARLCAEHGLEVTVFLIDEQSRYTGPMKTAISTLKKADVPVKIWKSGTSFTADLIVDAMVGIGLSGPLREPLIKLVSELNEYNCAKMAMDIPTGINADTAEVIGIAFEADITVTFIGLKLGLLTGIARNYVGRIFVEDLDLDEALIVSVEPCAMRTRLLDIQMAIPRRLNAMHKGELGHVLVIGGDYGMPGSVRMAGETALRCGAGLVSIATRPEHVAAIVSSRPELMCYGIDHEQDLAPLLERATIVIVGPGLTDNAWSEALVDCTFKAASTLDLPMIIDAGALIFVPKQHHQFPRAIFTPHPGEMARLLGTDVTSVNRDRLSAARACQAKWGGVVVLKGAGTITVTQDLFPEICTAGNPGMATAGMGDVLNGVIAGLLAQGFSPFNAALGGVMLHAESADMAEHESGECGMLATDLLPYLRQLMNPFVELRHHLEALQEEADADDDDDDSDRQWDEGESDEVYEELPDDDNEIIH